MSGWRWMISARATPRSVIFTSSRSTPSNSIDRSSNVSAPAALDAQIVQTIVSLAEGLGMDVVAEGVETALQLAHLRAIGCRSAQGFYFVRPHDG